MGKVEEDIINTTEITSEDAIQYLEFEIASLQSAYEALKQENELNKSALNF